MTTHKAAAQRAVAQADQQELTLPVLGAKIPLPSTDAMVFAAAVGALAVVEIVEWPVATVIVIGHLISRARHASKIEKAVGEALEEA